MIFYFSVTIRQNIFQENVSVQMFDDLEENYDNFQHILFTTHGEILELGLINTEHTVDTLWELIEFKFCFDPRNHRMRIAGIDENRNVVGNKDGFIMNTENSIGMEFKKIDFMTTSKISIYIIDIRYIYFPFVKYVPFIIPFLLL